MESQQNPFPVPSQQERAQGLSEVAGTNPIPASEEEPKVDVPVTNVITFPSQAEASAQISEKINGPDQNPTKPTNSSPESHGGQLAA